MPFLDRVSPHGGAVAGQQFLQEDVPQAEKDELKEIDGKITDAENAISAIYTEYAADNKIVHELIDLALLQNGMLKGEALSSFIRRSVELI